MKGPVIWFGDFGKKSSMEQRQFDRPPDPDATRKVQDTIDPKEWFDSRDIPMKEAKMMARKIQQHYPHLSHALDESKDVLPELELIQLIFDVQLGRFPVGKG